MINGVNTHPAWEFQSSATLRGQILDKMKFAGLTSVRIDFAWATIEPSRGNFSWTVLDRYINEAADRGLSVLLMLYWPPAWSSGSTSKSGVPAQPQHYGEILGRVAERYGDKLAAIEMWNEPDLARFWSGTRVQFANLLSVAYPIAKSMSPTTTFVAASPTYLGLANNWFRDVFVVPSYRRGYAYDALAIHPYMSPSNLPPEAVNTNWSILGIQRLREFLYQYGEANTPLWATEFGWSTHVHPTNAPNHARGVSEQQQAQYTVEALSLLAQEGVVASYIYTDMDMPGSDPHEANFGLLRSDASSKPVMHLLAETLRIPEPDLPEEPYDPNQDIIELYDHITSLNQSITSLIDQLTQMANHSHHLAASITEANARIWNLELAQGHNQERFRRIAEGASWTE